MKTSETRSGRRRAFGVGTVAAVATAIVLSATVGGGASASSNPVTETTAGVSSSVSADREGVLSDGYVSDSEMQETIDRVVQCVGETGHQAERVDFLPGIGWSMDIVTETSAEADRVSAAVDQCNDAHAEVMDTYWLQNRLAPAEQERFEDLIRECLVAKGVEMDDSQGRSLAASVPVRDGDLFTQCQVEAQAKVR